MSAREEWAGLSATSVCRSTTASQVTAVQVHTTFIHSIIILSFNHIFKCPSCLIEIIWTRKKVYVVILITGKPLKSELIGAEACLD